MEKNKHVVCIRLNLKALTEFKGNVRYNKCTLRPLPPLPPVSRITDAGDLNRLSASLL